MKQKETGSLIALEGIDGVGKSTLARSLAEYFQRLGRSVVLTKEPGATPFGVELRTVLSARAHKIDPIAEFLLFSADRAQHMKEIVIPSLASGAIVISDRMADSARAYQGFGRGIDRGMIEQVTGWVTAGIKPNITFYIALDPAIAYERIIQRGQQRTSFEQEQREFFDRVVKGFETIFARRDDVIKLDGLLPSQDLAVRAIAEMNERYFV